jgi:hypothetical protein
MPVIIVISIVVEIFVVECKPLRRNPTSQRHAPRRGHVIHRGRKILILAPFHSL